MDVEMILEAIRLAKSQSVKKITQRALKSLANQGIEIVSLSGGIQAVRFPFYAGIQRAGDSIEITLSACTYRYRQGILSVANPQDIPQKPLLLFRGRDSEEGSIYYNEEELLFQPVEIQHILALFFVRDQVAYQTWIDAERTRPDLKIYEGDSAEVIARKKRQDLEMYSRKLLLSSEGIYLLHTYLKWKGNTSLF